MTRRTLTVAALILALSTLSWAHYSDQWSECEFLPGRMIIDFTESTLPHIPTESSAGVVEIGIPSLDELFQEFDATVVFRLVPDGTLDKLKVPPDMYRTYVVIFRDEYPVLDVVDRFAANPFVKMAMPDLLYREFRVPNDPRWSSQWDKRQVGSDLVWDVSQGDSAVIVTGIDTGVDWNHPDLGYADVNHPEGGSPLWVNPEEDLNGNRLRYDFTDYPGDSQDLDGLDNDANGYIDDFLGWDFIRNIGGCDAAEDCDNRMDNDMWGRESHGTHVGGIMAAHGNNGVGVAGHLWYGQLMALRCGYRSAQGQGYMPESATTPGIIYAAANGARVINMSYGGTGFSSPQQNALNSAWTQGCINFAATGNDGHDQIQYPANYDNVISVNATGQSDIMATWSNYGTWTDICSPGEGIMSTVNQPEDGGYTAYDGTSMASPNAAGAAALIWSIFPNLTNAELRDLIFNTCVNIYPQNPGYSPGELGHGRISARNMLAQFYPHLLITGIDLTDPDSDARLESGETGNFQFDIQNEAGWAVASDVTVTVTTNDQNLTITNEAFSLGTIQPGQSATNSGDLVQITCAALPSGVVYDTEIVLHFETSTGAASETPVTLRVGRGTVLLVDDDLNFGFEANYATALESAARSYDVWHTLSEALSAFELSHYNDVIWVCGDDSVTTFTTQEQSAVTAWLATPGRNFIVVGQYIDEDLTGTQFYSDVLHATTEAGAGDRRLLGITGNPISDGMSLLLQGSCRSNSSRSPSRMTPANGAAALFDYQTGGTGGVYYDGTYKLIYCGFALEGACGNSNTDSYDEVLLEMFNWMNIVDADEPSGAVVPKEIALHQNFPNPFNPTTSITFDLVAQGKVSLRVFDVNGREVATLADDVMQAGTHTLNFDGSNFSSGVYFAQLDAGSIRHTVKLVLLK